MRLKKYNQDKILAPLKCGTRFLDETFGGDSGNIGIIELLETKQYIIPNLQAIIIRPPYEHLVSALRTEILNVYNSEDTKPTFDAVKMVVKSFMVENSNWKKFNTAHWSQHLYQGLYLLWRRNKDKIKIIQLKDLSVYLKSINVEIQKYDAEKYNFNYYRNWFSKEDIIIYLKNYFCEEWEDYMKQVEDCDRYYKILIGEVKDESKLI
jgi:hypothetical protein